MFVLVMEYIPGSIAPECIFHYEHKTLYNLFSPDPAVSCVADTLASHREIHVYILCSFFYAACLLGVCHFVLAINAFRWDT